MLGTAVLLWAFNAPSSVDFAHRSAPLPVVVQALGKALGKELSASAVYDDTDLYVGATDVDQDTLLAQVASAADGAWTPWKGGLILMAQPGALARARAYARKTTEGQFAEAYSSGPPETPWTTSEIRSEMARARQVLSQ